MVLPLLVFQIRSGLHFRNKSPIIPMYHALLYINIRAGKFDFFEMKLSHKGPPESTPNGLQPTGICSMGPKFFQRDPLLKYTQYGNLVLNTNCFALQLHFCCTALQVKLDVDALTSHPNYGLGSGWWAYWGLCWRRKLGPVLCGFKGMG